MTYQMPEPTYAPPVKKSTGLAVSALILGIAAFLTGWIPALGTILAVLAVVFGIVALVKKQPKGLSITGLSLGAVALVFSLIMIPVYIGIGSATDTTAKQAESPTESPKTKPTEVEKPEPKAEPVADGKTRDTPLPIGSTVETKEWAVTVNSVVLDANQAVADANMFNSPAAEGNQYILVNVTATYHGTDAEGSMPWATVAYVSPDGNTYDGTVSLAVAPEQFDRTSPLYEGASTTGNIVLEVPSAGLTDGRLAVKADMFADKRFFTMQ